MKTTILFIYLFIDIEMSRSDQSIEEYYTQYLRCTTCLHYFEYENSMYHPITFPGRVLRAS